MEKSSDKERFSWIGRVFVLLLMLYVFLTAIALFGDAIEMVGQDTAKQLFKGLKNPFAALAVGILATVLVQSSSVTTSMIVAAVGASALTGGETLPLAYAIPMVMGANIGTSITNTLVSLGHVTRDAEFRRAFAGATVHDIFNLLTVLILFPLEITTGFLRKSAVWLVAHLPIEGTGGKFHSPIKGAVKAFVKLIDSFFHNTLGMENGSVLAIVFAVLALVMVVFALIIITRVMKSLMADRIEQWLNRVLKKRGSLGILIGMLVTMAVQSSSITTSLLIPLFGAGILTVEAGFPIMVGANIGTTATALIAATVAGPAGLTIAIVHLLFNLIGTALFFPVQKMRRIPIFLAEQLANAASKNRIWIVVYILGVFIVLPVLGILIWK